MAAYREIQEGDTVRFPSGNPNWPELYGRVTNIISPPVGDDRVVTIVRRGQRFELLESEVHKD